MADPNRVIGRASGFVLELEESWKLVGDVPDVGFTCGTAEIDDRAFVY